MRLAAVENNVQPVKSATEIENEIRMEYQYKLKLDDTTIPDPYLIAAGWSNEQIHISEKKHYVWSIREKRQPFSFTFVVFIALFP